MSPWTRATALPAWDHGKLTRRFERIGMVEGKEVIGTEPREVRTGGRVHTSHALGLSARPTTSGLSHWERPLSSRGGRTLGTKSGYHPRPGSVWGTFGLVGAVQGCRLKPTIHSPASHAEPWMGLGGPKGPSGKVKKSSLASPSLWTGQR